MFRALKKAAEKYPNIGLALFGPGLSGDAFAEAVRNARVAQHLECFGELDHDEALGLISGCDAFIRPTTADGDSISVREALTLGIPCVASDVCARPEGTITFRSGDADDLVAKLVEAIEQKSVSVRSPDAGPVMLELYEAIRNPRPAVLRPKQAEPEPLSANG
jgi:glycosyltransferase involved in cell wall biosynthesis